MNALVIQHHQFETLGANFQNILTHAGYQIGTLPLYCAAPDFIAFDAPSIDEVDLIVALGGPMSANDALPALHSEMAYLSEAADAGKRVIGICLGAQLLAQAFGGVVRPTGGYQFGLRKLWVSRAGTTDPAFSRISTPLVPTLHGECFSIPPGSTRLAEGFMLRRDGRYLRINMAFRYRNSYGLQFEPQLTVEELEVWNREMASDYELMGGEFDPEIESERNLREFRAFAPIHQEQMAAFLESVLSL